MCPVCIITAAFVIAGGSSAGGLTVFAVNKLRQRNSPEKNNIQLKSDTKE